MTVVDSRLEACSPIVGRRPQLELLRTNGCMARFRKRNHVADGRRPRRTVVEPVQKNQAECPALQVLNADHVRHREWRRGSGVRGPVTLGYFLEFSVGNLDRVDAQVTDDQAPIAVARSG